MALFYVYEVGFRWKLNEKYYMTVVPVLKVIFPIKRKLKRIDCRKSRALS